MRDDKNIALSMILATSVSVWGLFLPMNMNPLRVMTNEVGEGLKGVIMTVIAAVEMNRYGGFG